MMIQDSSKQHPSEPFMTRDQAQAALDDLLAVCRKHNIVLVGTCLDEGIYGEITILDSLTLSGHWIDIQSQITNTLEDQSFYGRPEFTITGIGDLA